jgi:hypothetical protein
MTCAECNGTGQIVLFTSVTKCGCKERYYSLVHSRHKDESTHHDEFKPFIDDVLNELLDVFVMKISNDFRVYTDPDIIRIESVHKDHWAYFLTLSYFDIVIDRNDDGCILIIKKKIDDDS